MPEARPISVDMQLDLAPDNAAIQLLDSSDMSPSMPIKVLLVEDDIDAAALVRFSLADKRNGAFELEWVNSLRDAMARVASPGIDVVLLDLGLPELQGFRSHRALALACWANIPIVIYSSDDSAASRKLTTGFGGAADYLVKQVTSPADIRRSLCRAVRGICQSY